MQESEISGTLQGQQISLGFTLQGHIFHSFEGSKAEKALNVCETL